MKNKLILIAIGGSLLLATPALRAEEPANKPAQPTHREGGGKGGPPEHLLPPTVIDRLKLTDDQKPKYKAIEESYLKTRKEYMDAHKAEFDAAKTGLKDARESKDETKTKEARAKMGSLMEGLKPHREAAISQVKSLLTDEQKQALEGAKKDVKERHGSKKADAPAAK